MRFMAKPGMHRQQAVPHIQGCGKHPKELWAGQKMEKGKGGEVVSSWFRLGPRLMSKIPGTRPPCLDVIIYGVIIIWMLLEHPLRVGVLVLLAVDRPTPGMCLTFRSIFKARVLFSRAAGLVFWSPAGLAPPLTGQSFREC